MKFLQRDSHPNGMTAFTFKNRREITVTSHGREIGNCLYQILIVNTQVEMTIHLESEAQNLKSELIVK